MPSVIEIKYKQKGKEDREGKREKDNTIIPNVIDSQEFVRMTALSSMFSSMYAQSPYLIPHTVSSFEITHSDYAKLTRLSVSGILSTNVSCNRHHSMHYFMFSHYNHLHHHHRRCRSRHHYCHRIDFSPLQLTSKRYKVFATVITFVPQFPLT